MGSPVGPRSPLALSFWPDVWYKEWVFWSALGLESKQKTVCYASNSHATIVSRGIACLAGHYCSYRVHKLGKAATYFSLLADCIAPSRIMTNTQ